LPLKNLEHADLLEGLLCPKEDVENGISVTTLQEKDALLAKNEYVSVSNQSSFLFVGAVSLNERAGPGTCCIYNFVHRNNEQYVNVYIFFELLFQLDVLLQYAETTDNPVFAGKDFYSQVLSVNAAKLILYNNTVRYTFHNLYTFCVRLPTAFFNFSHYYALLKKFFYSQGKREV